MRVKRALIKLSGEALAVLPRRRTRRRDADRHRPGYR